MKGARIEWLRADGARLNGWLAGLASAALVILIAAAIARGALAG